MTMMTMTVTTHVCVCVCTCVCVRVCVRVCVCFAWRVCMARNVPRRVALDDDVAEDILAPPGPLEGERDVRSDDDARRDLDGAVQPR
jgi:hypothetical protein